jgi:hypothetical protein
MCHLSQPESFRVRHCHGDDGLSIAVLPWLATLLVFLVLVNIPELSLWLPRVFSNAVRTRVHN